MLRQGARVPKHTLKHMLGDTGALSGAPPGKLGSVRGEPFRAWGKPGETAGAAGETGERAGEALSTPVS